MKFFYFFIAAFLTISNGSNAQNLDILWEIKNPRNNVVSYVIGVKHTSCADDSLDVKIRNKIYPLLAGSDVLIMEPSAGDDLPVEEQIKLISIPKGKTLKDIYTAEEFDLIASFCDQQGVSFSYGLDKLHPVLLKEHLMSTFNTADCTKKKSIEDEVREIAEKDKKGIVFIENSREVLEAYISMPLQKQKQILLEFCKDPTGFVPNGNLYYKEYFMGIDKIKSKERANMGYIGGPEFAENIINKRNFNWLGAITPILEEKASFIIVGVGHLGSEHGIINLLRSNFELRNIPIE